jgi:hypothetical protein
VILFHFKMFTELLNICIYNSDFFPTQTFFPDGVVNSLSEFNVDGNNVHRSIFSTR